MKKTILMLTVVIFGLVFSKSKIANAQNSDTEMFECDEGIKAYSNNDYAKAFEWFQKAAGKENVLAMSWLGFLYHNGSGVQQDYLEAYIWYKKAADKGNAYAMEYIGLLFQNGGGNFVQSYEKALEWYLKAVENGRETAKQRIAQIESIQSSTSQQSLNSNSSSITQNDNNYNRVGGVTAVILVYNRNKGNYIENESIRCAVYESFSGNSTKYRLYNPSMGVWFDVQRNSEYSPKEVNDWINRKYGNYVPEPSRKKRYSHIGTFNSGTRYWFVYFNLEDAYR